MNISKTIWLILSIALTACGSEVVLDNSSDEQRTVFLDKESWVLAPGAWEVIHVSPGDFQVKITADSGVVASRRETITETGGIINAGTGEYVLWKEMYGDTALRKKVLHEEWREIDSVQYYADIVIYHLPNLYIEKKWDFDLDEPFPTDIMLQTDEDYTLKTKIFRMNDFLIEYQKLTE